LSMDASFKERSPVGLRLHQTTAKFERPHSELERRAF
jgi:hypothetical protein